MIDTPIKKNSLKLLKHLASVTLKTPQIKVTASTLIKLRDARTARPIQAKELFQNEFTCVPEALFKDRKPYHSVKSKLLQFIEFPSTPEDQERYNLASVRGLVVDLSVVIVAKGAFANRKDSCFDDFANRVLRGIADNTDRIDIVADLYDPFSIKGPTRKDSGIGPRLVFDGDAKLLTDFSLFFKNDEK